MVSTLRTQLHCSLHRPLFGHHIVASFMQRVARHGGSATADIPADVLRTADAAGRVALELPDRHDICPDSAITLRVFSPDGGLVGLEEVTLDALDRGEPVCVRIYSGVPRTAQTA